MNRDEQAELEACERQAEVIREARVAEFKTVGLVVAAAFGLIVFLCAVL